MIHTKRKESSDNDVTVVDLHLTSVTVQEVLKKPRLLNSKCLGLCFSILKTSCALYITQRQRAYEIYASSKCPEISLTPKIVMSTRQVKRELFTVVAGTNRIIPYLTFLIKLEASHLSTMIFRSFLDPFRFKSFHRKKSSSANGLQLSVFLKYIYYYQKSNWKKGGPTNFFIFPPRERALSPAGLMGDSMMLLHAWHKGQCGSTDQVAWLNPRFFRVFWFDGSIFFRDAMNIQELLLP